MALSSDAIITLIILTAAIVLFLTNRLRADVVALLVLVSLGATGILTPQEAFSGFSRSAVVIIVTIFVLAQGLNLTGAGEKVGDWLIRVAGQSEGRLVILVMIAGAFLSLFMNNIAAAAVLLPGVSGAANKQGTNPSRVLMPLAFATILGGMATLFTTTNIVTSGLLREQGLPGFGVLTFLPPGLPIAAVGIAYMAAFGRRLLPRRPSAEVLNRPLATRSEDLVEVYQLDERLFRARIPPGSMLDGRSLAQSSLRERFNVNVLSLERNGQIRLAPPPDTLLQVGDVVMLEGSLEEFRERDIQPYLEILAPKRIEERDLESEGIIVVEAALAPRSGLFGKTLQSVNFREQFGYSALAIWRGNRPIRRGMTTLPLQLGDALFLQGPRNHLRLLQQNPDIILLDVPSGTEPTVRSDKLALAVVIVVITLAISATNIIPTAEMMLVGALAMVLLGVLSADEAYGAIEWKAVVLVAGMLPMGLALTNTGLADLAAAKIVALAAPYGPRALLAALFILTTLLAQVISGPAVAAIVVPLAISAARQTGIDPQSLSMGVALATSMAFLTPLGHPVNILVMGLGGYRFADYFKVGLPLTILLTLLILLALPVVYPL